MPERREFQPSQQAQRGDTAQTSLSEEERQFRRDRGISVNYRGSLEVPSNGSANIPHEQNTSIFIKTVPPSITYHSLMKMLEGKAGRVYASHITPAAPPFVYAAVKITFFKHDAADFVIRQINNGTMTLGGHRMSAVWNRIRVPERHLKAASRVLHVQGPAKIVNLAFLGKFLVDHLKYDLDWVSCDRAVADSPRMAELEFHFGSWHCQAEFASMALGQTFPHVLRWYGDDPCCSDDNW
ncbi:hypothetical protein F4778DRAFT_410448 [Xylariomycetidae sp. FL2044]|nr:hypothetical protein F4778DRAFT_410448 [Xylariomycetidae sp. FL2044]